eukprot:CAMPEP_0196582016 /NCGR_PEP_ID=MMETSP1081-20130531/37038_1 /TAXON_ID=36882 /ORGANISM="Pyramimonas amylifera, Strain CCMP720" /LENGTH=425 /DNA_ID=CAMNT_0041902469 /DNA_START=63 /DNA_END=1340 /DNA_ORIENTATION=+
MEQDEGWSWAEGELRKAIAISGLDVTGSAGAVRRTSSRFCLGVEHGDYNGTELFGVGTDRFIWMAFKPNGTNRVRMYSTTFSEDDVVEFEVGGKGIPPPQSAELASTWARFPYGVDYILNREGFTIAHGFDAVLVANIPGGGMSRSASLTLNLLLTFLEVNNLKVEKEFRVVELAQAVENVYIGSPCGLLDQIMIYFAKEGMGTHYNPSTQSITHVAFGGGDQATERARSALRFVSLDTGTIRPGLEKSTYKVRRNECDAFVEALKLSGFKIQCLADIKSDSLRTQVIAKFEASNPEWCARMQYIYDAQKRFYTMLEAWRFGDLETIGDGFRSDGHGLRDLYKISGPELESMCDIVRVVPGVLGERMLGGGDKGAAGAIVRAEAVSSVQTAVAIAYPRCHPNFADKYAVHSCRIVDGVKVFRGLL